MARCAGESNWINGITPFEPDRRKHGLAAMVMAAHMPYRMFSSPLARSAMTTPSAGGKRPIDQLTPVSLRGQAAERPERPQHPRQENRQKSIHETTPNPPRQPDPGDKNPHHKPPPNPNRQYPQGTQDSTSTPPPHPITSPPHDQDHDPRNTVPPPTHPTKIPKNPQKFHHNPPAGSERAELREQRLHFCARRWKIDYAASIDEVPRLRKNALIISAGQPYGN